jgi:hypothetical protein
MSSSETSSSAQIALGDEQQQPTPPSFERGTDSVIELSSVEASKISGVSVYSGRAEITRSFTFNVKTGQNNVRINGLPSCMDRQSLR